MRQIAVDQKKALFIGFQDDPHLHAVGAALTAMGRDWDIFDPRGACDEPSLVFCPGDLEASRLRCSTGWLSLAMVSAIWLRRLPLVECQRHCSQADSAFAQKEWSGALDGVLQCIGVPILNAPVAQRSAGKLLQLSVARSVELTIPLTVITNDPVAVKSFDNAGRETIHKSIANQNQPLLETKVLDEAGIALLDTLSLAPAIFQERIRGSELRITICGDAVFAARYPIGDPDCVDVRTPEPAMVAVDVPEAVVKRLKLLMKALGLRMGAIDMKMTADGGYVFLEINPQGQFLFVEHRTGQPIAQSVATLISHDMQRQDY